MQDDETQRPLRPATLAQRRSHFVVRAMEWDDPKARYPNIWVDGMPRQLLAIERIAGRLRLGDLVATYHPPSQRHPDRADRVVGISRVAGLRRAEQAGLAWIELETAYRFDPPFKLEPAPRRVFLCCDPGWPAEDVGLFDKIYAAATAAGWTPSADEAFAPDPAATSDPDPVPSPPPAATAVHAPPKPRSREAAGSTPADVRAFAGVHYCGDMRDPRAATWLAVLGLVDDRLRVLRVTATGRHGLEAQLRDPDTLLSRAEAIGLDFPFAFPQPFGEALLGGPFPDEGWWALARRLERLTLPQFLTHAQEYREAAGAACRVADEHANAGSPLDRNGRDPCSMAFHGMRMIGEDRSRFAIRPFETAKGRLLLEVRPDALVAAMSKGSGNPSPIERLERLPVTIGEHGKRIGQRAALAAVLAARCAALAVLDGETDKSAEELAPGQGPRVLCEGWIYGREPSG